MLRRRRLLQTSQLFMKTVIVSAQQHLLHAAVVASAIRIDSLRPNAGQHMVPVWMRVSGIQTLTLTLKEPSWTKPKGG